MATDLTDVAGTILDSVRITSKKSADLSVPQDPFSLSVSKSVTFGSGDDQMDQIWHDQRTLALSTSEDLDLSGALVNAFGGSVLFATVKLIMIQNVGGNRANLAVGGAALNTADLFFSDSTDIMLLDDGGVFLYYQPNTGFTITAGTADILQIENLDGGQAAIYNIVIGGTSA